MSLPYCKQPCAECPWRQDVRPGKFPAQRFIDLAGTAYDLAPTVFACHMSSEGKDAVCAGFILSQGLHNMALRMAGHRFEVRSSVPLYATYRRMAIANGVPTRHSALIHCRDDGQTQR